MNKLLKKLLSGIIAVSVVTSAAVLPQVSFAEDEQASASTVDEYRDVVATTTFYNAATDKEITSFDNSTSVYGKLVIKNNRSVSSYINFGYGLIKNGENIAPPNLTAPVEIEPGGEYTYTTGTFKGTECDSLTVGGGDYTEGYEVYDNGTSGSYHVYNYGGKIENTDALPSDGLLAYISFDETGAGSGSFDALGTGVTEHGSVSYVETYDGNKALSIDTNAAGNYLELSKGILSGKEAATYSFMIKPSSGWAFMTTPVSGAQEYLKEKYLGMLATDSAFTAERYNNSGTRLSSVGSNGDYSEWKYVTVVFEADGTKLYVDGELVKSDTAAVNIKDLFTSSASTWIGHGNWGSGEGFSGMIDDFRIYGKALGEDEIAKLATAAESYKTQALVYENNSYIFDTHFEIAGGEIFSFSKDYIPHAIPSSDGDLPAGPGVFNVKTNVKNYYGLTTRVQTVLSYVDVDDQGDEYLVAESEYTDVPIAGSADITINVPDGTALAIPDNAKLVVKANIIADMDEFPSYTIAELYSDIEAPVAAPADSDTTTNGAHDPSIVKFDGDDTYYVYSSHHLIFTSTDLINWKKYDFTNINAKDISPKTYNFIASNYSNTTMNGTYWAPDVIYRAGEEKPYWMYISLSCGLGGRNSAISLIKSPTPLFWADPDKDKVAQIEDAGVVFATKENSRYKTNAIDANIYYDSSDGNKPYFVWGSFWGGIQAAPLTSEGRVEGIDYTSDSTILNSCQNFGTSIFTQKRGVAGPEGAWMIEHGDYRYAFTSYAWLGSNYNTRVARAPLGGKFSENTGTQLVDANGTVMGNEFSRSTGSVSKSEITGYKLIGSYRLGEGSMALTENESNDWYYARGAGDAHVYYGPGHNSVINAGDETFYVSHTRKDAVEGAATLQVRKLLFTKDGWPVVSPVTYAGEIEQRLPKSMLSGTYDLASVGETKLASGDTTINENWKNHSGNRNYDLPVISSKITLNDDGTLADSLGTWEFDGDHTITITFAKTGNSAKDEFYTAGDKLTMYALFGYDKDESEPVIALTGVNQNHVTQFAKKSLSNEYTYTPSEDEPSAPTATPAVEPTTAPTTAPTATPEVKPTTAPEIKPTKEPFVIPTAPAGDAITLTKSTGNNPVLGFDANGNTLYAGDPAAYVDGDTVYLYAGHDTASNESYVMPNWVCYSSKDMVNWKYEGVTMNATDISWRSNDTSAWASQVVKHGDKYYMYYCTWTKSEGGRQSIGVAVADSPTGPFKDPLNAPLIPGTKTTPQSASHDDIDPTVWIEKDENGTEHRYLCWGNTRLYICELNEDMISVKDLDGDGSVTMGKDIIEQTVSGAPASYTEAPWLYRRQDENGNYYGKYYLFYAMGWREQMAYATTDNLLNTTWEYGGLLMPPSATANTNHPAVIDFKGHTYFIYHNGALPHGSGFRRSVCIEEFTINDDGTIDPIQETSTGLAGTAVTLVQGDDLLNHEYFVNPGADGSYPITASVSVNTKISDMKDTYWEIVAGKADKTNESYVSIQSYNKPGLYLCANDDKTVVLTQDATADSNGAVKKKMTFKTVAGLSGDDGSVSFESVSQPGYYITKQGDDVVLTDGTDKSAATFNLGYAEDAKIPSMIASVDKVWYEDNKTVHFRVKNAAIYGSADIRIAEYDAEGKLIGVETSGDEQITSNTQLMDIDYSRKAENSTLKLFVWETDSMTPIASASDIVDTELVYTIPEGYTSYFPFDEDNKDQVTGLNATLAAEHIEGDTITLDPPRSEGGYKGKAMAFPVSGGGLSLGNVITDSKYTVSFRMKANAFTACTSAIFIDNGSKSSEDWLSAPFGPATGGNTSYWSNKGSGNHTTVTSSAALKAGEWNMITLTADNGKVKMYVDGVLTANGKAVSSVSEKTVTYLGVNYWDPVFSGMIDDVYIYNGTVLNDDQIEDLYFATQAE